MWIGLVVIILVNGQVIQDYSMTVTESECKEEMKKLDQYMASKSAVVSRYKGDCYFVDDLMKPGTPT